MRYAEASFSGDGAAKREPVLPNSVLGVIVFILTEAMFFIALISAYSISASGAAEWPPADQPRLPVEATAFNSVMLLFSAATIFLGYRTFETDGFGAKSQRWLLGTIALGAYFVIAQGVEWAGLISYGLTLTSSNYGGFFYLVIGAHALHAVGALIALVRVYFKMRSGKLRAETYQGTQIFWYFVVGVWPVLYVLVYLN